MNMKQITPQANNSEANNAKQLTAKQITREAQNNARSATNSEANNAKQLTFKIIYGMKKEKIAIEYPLRSASITVLWNAISAPSGLAEWFAEGVTVEGGKYIFSWEGDAENSAYVQKIKPNESIRFQWEDDKDSDAYFELCIVVPELGGEVALVVTDFAEVDEVNDVKLLWDKHIEDLRRKYGM
jgi:uncharacterized protein YndB with AHSA1/START domain